MRHSKTLLLLGMALGLLGNAYSQDSPLRNSQFEDFKGDGYYWYRKEPVPVKPKIEPPPIPPAPTVAPAPAPAKESIKPLSTEWMRSNLPKLLDKAVDEPTSENVSNYMYATRVALDKAQNFAEKFKEVGAMDPFLDENNRVPMSGYAQQSFLNQLRTGKDEVMDYLGSKSGLWVFIDDPDKCSACAGYVKDILVGTTNNKGVATRFGFNLRILNINSTEGKNAATRLNLKVTPTTVLVIPPKGYLIVSQGLMAQPQLYDRIMIASNSHGAIPKNLQKKVDPYNNGIMSTEEISNIKSEDSPSEVMRKLRERIKGKQ